MKLLMLTLLFATTLFGHKLYIMASDENDTLHVKAYFTKSATCKACDVKIYDESGKIKYSGKTDQNGEINFPFTINNPKIEITASMGHKNEIIYKCEKDLSVDKNISFTKILLSLMAIFGISLVLKVIKR